MIQIVVRTVILYLLIVLIMRLMGKRELAQLQPFDLVIAIIIADLAAVPMAEIGIPLLYGIIPILVLSIVHLLLSVLMLKSEKVRSFISGVPSIIIEKGVIKEEELEKLRFNLNELIEQLRNQGYQLEEVDHAVMETSGNLSVIPKSDFAPLQRQDFNLPQKDTGLPITLILDGNFNEDNLQKTQWSSKKLLKTLEKHGVDSEKDVLLAILHNDGQLYVHTKGASPTTAMIQTGEVSS